MLRRILLASCAVFALSEPPAFANDTMAELRTGGLIFVRNDVVVMESEDLSISMDKVTVDYVFRNPTDEDVEGIVAFPMPDIEANPYSMVSIPDAASDNFLDFQVSVEGVDIKPTLDQRALAAGLDVSEQLNKYGIALFPYAEGNAKALAKLPPEVVKDWVIQGIITKETYDDGNGMEDHVAPFWTLKSSYWWKTRFPASNAVKVHHTYKPSVGGTSGVSFLEDGAARGERHDEYVQRYCLDGAFDGAVVASARKNPDNYPPYTETWISYVLKTGSNWAANIGKFHLKIDKGSVDNLVSFCGKDVRKTGPTTFEIDAEDFYPGNDIDILILRPLDSVAPGEGAEPTNGLARPADETAQ